MFLLRLNVYHTEITIRTNDILQFTGKSVFSIEPKMGLETYIEIFIQN